MNALNKFLNMIAKETDGFKIGDPWRPPKSGSIACVLPITRKTLLSRRYVTASETSLRFIIKDTGSIDSVNVTNTLETPLFLSTGQMLSGDTQERAIAHSVVVLSGQTRPVSVVCVHQSRSISGGTAMTLDRDVRREVEQEMYPDEKRSTSAPTQDRVWEEIERVNRKDDDSGRETDDLKKYTETHLRKMQQVLDQVPEIPSQVGMAIIACSGIYSMQCFDSPDSWRERRKALIEKEFSALSRTGDDSPLFKWPESDNMTRILHAFVSQDFESNPIETDSQWQTNSLYSGNYAGEATMFDGYLIHLSLGLKPVAMLLERIAEERDYGRKFVHADQVTKMSLELYNSLCDLGCFPQNKDDLFLLRAVGYLHDVGYPPETDHHINGFNWLKERLNRPDVKGILSEADYSIILHCVLWHRDHDFAVNNRVSLNRQHLKIARRLAGVLRIADGLCFPDGAPTLRVSASKEKDALVIEACPTKHGKDLRQISHAMDKKDLLQEVLTTTPGSGINRVEVKSTN